MTLRLNLVSETEKACLYEFKDGTSTWIPRSVIKSRVKFPHTDLTKPQVHEVRVEEWWWNKYMEEND